MCAAITFIGIPLGQPERLQVAQALAGVIRDIEISLISAAGLQQFHRPRLESVQPVLESLRQCRDLRPALRVLGSLRNSQRQVGPPRKFLDMREAARAVYDRVCPGLPDAELGAIWAAIPNGTEATTIPDYLPQPAAICQVFHGFPSEFRACLEQLVPAVNANNRGQFSYNGATLDRSALLLRATAMEWVRCNIGELHPALESWRSLLSWFAMTSKVFSDGFIHKLVYKREWVGLKDLPAKRKLRLIREVIHAVNERFNERFDDGFVLRLHERDETTSVQYYIERFAPDPKLEVFFAERVPSRSLRELLQQASGRTMPVLLGSRKGFVDGLLDAVVALQARLHATEIPSTEGTRLLWALATSLELLRAAGSDMERTDVIGSLVYRGLRQPQIRAVLDRMNAAFGTNYRLIQRVKKNLALEGEEAGYFLGIPFFPGDWVVCPGQGVAQLKGLTVEKIMDQAHLFLQFEVFNVVTRRQSVVRVPRFALGVRRLRPISSSDEAAKARCILASGKIEDMQGGARQGRCQGWLAGGSLADLATAVVHLKRWFSAKEGAGLWALSLRDTIRSALAQELALIEGGDPQEVLASIP